MKNDFVFRDVVTDLNDVIIAVKVQYMLGTHSRTAPANSLPLDMLGDLCPEPVWIN